MSVNELQISDGLLWQQFLSGDEEAFKQIYKNSIMELFNYGKRFSYDEGLVKDCIQDLFVDLHRYRTKLSKTDKIMPYLFLSLKRLIIKRTNAELAKKHFSIDLLPFEIEVKEDTTGEVMERRLELLKAAIDDLSPRQREAIYLKYVSGLSYEELTEVLNLKYQTSRNLIYKGMEKLRKNLNIL